MNPASLDGIARAGGGSSLPEDSRHKNAVNFEANSSEGRNGEPSTTVKFASILAQWWMECLALFVGLGLLGTIFSVLAINQGETVGHWTVSGINLNSFVAILSAILRAMILLIVEEVISQQKWLWQLRRRPLAQLNSIDEASRGLLGSILLPFRLRTWRSNIYVGCLIMVLSLAIGPFTQQAVGNRPCQVLKNGASAKVPYTFRGPEYFRFGAGQFEIEPGYTRRMISACMEPDAQTSSFLVDGCTTGNCTFKSDEKDSYSLSTIGICSKCIDTTKYLEILPAVDKTHYDAVVIPSFDTVNLTGEGSITGLRSYPSNLTWLSSDFDDNLRAIYPASIMNYTIVGTTSSGCDYTNQTSDINHCTPTPPLDFTWKTAGLDQPMNVFSSACTFYVCMRHHKLSVERNIFQEELVSSSPGFFLDSENLMANVYTWKPKCKVGDDTIDLTKARTVSYRDKTIHVRLNDSSTQDITFPNTTNCVESVSWTSWRGLVTSMGLLEGNCHYPLQASINNVKGRKEQVQCEPYYLSGLLYEGLGSSEAVSNTFRAIANSITNRMRQLAVQNNFTADVAGPVYSGPEQKQGGYVYGTVLETSVCTEFHKSWLIFPLLLLAATAFFLLYTVTRSVLRRHQEPIWKSSILPALYASRESQLHVDIHSLAEMEKRSARDSVQLVKVGDNKWELTNESDQEQPHMSYTKKEGKRLYSFLRSRADK